MVSLEDAIIDRLHSLDSTGDLDSFNRAMTLLGVVELDRARLESRAGDEGLREALDRLDQAAANVAAGRLFEAHDVHDLFGRFGGGSTMS